MLTCITDPEMAKHDHHNTIRASQLGVFFQIPGKSIPNVMLLCIHHKLIRLIANPIRTLHSNVIHHLTFLAAAHRIFQRSQKARRLVFLSLLLQLRPHNTTLRRGVSTHLLSTMQIQSIIWPTPNRRDSRSFTTMALHQA